MLLLAAVLFINYVDRGLLPAAADRVQTDTRLSTSQLGLLLSAFFWTYALIQVPIGWIAERFGAGRVLMVGLTIWAGATMLFGLTHGFVTMLALRLLLGIGESVGFPCVSKLLAVNVAVGELGIANGIVGFAYLIGPAFGTYFGGIAIAHYGWRMTFIAFGALSLIWLLPWLFVGKRHSRPQLPRAGDPTFGEILRQPALWGASLGHFSSNYGYYFMLSWLPYYLVRERGFSTTGMAEAAGSAYVVTAVCALVAGWAIDRYAVSDRSRNLAYKSIMAAAHGGAVVCMLGIALGPPPLALLFIFVYQGLTGAASPGVFAIPQILAGPRAAGRWVGVQNSIGNFAGVVAPAVTGFLIAATGNFTLAFVLAAAVSLLGLYGWLVMIPPIAELRWESGGRADAQ
ncbi:MAG TPA: MFS transporter [Steroidobacteraceae bacterium]|nr:MFS transporter [Steroidobacteraceae bacterium]